MIVAAKILDAFKINVSWLEVFDDDQKLHKKRVFGVDWVIFFGNIFLKFSNSKILMYPSVKYWKRWESYHFNLLHGDQYQCFDQKERELTFDILPGKTLLELIKTKQFDREVIKAVAIEFNRAHRTYSKLTNQNYSHGDPHLENFLYDQKSNKAYIIDFETCHEKHLNEAERHADDILVFLLDCMGRLSETLFLDVLETFFSVYSYNEKTLLNLKKRLVVPTGLEKILWLTRTNYLGKKNLKKALLKIDQSIENTLIQNRLEF